MLTFPFSGAAALTVSGVTTTEAATDPTAKSTALPTVLSGAAANHPPTPQPAREQVRHLLLGTPSGIQATIGQLHQLGYADPNDWSRPLPTGRPNEVMAILTKRVAL